MILKEIAVESKNENTYPYNIKIFKDGFNIKFNNNVTIISGENGCGKSTILKYIADNVGFNILGGNKNSNYKSTENLRQIQDIKLSWSYKTKKGFYFRSDTFNSYYNYIESEPQVLAYYRKKFSELSHGESFLELFDSFKEGIFLLDEPENALSPQNQLRLLSIINELSKQKETQIIVVTHSPIIMSYPNADFIYIDNEVKRMNYKDTSHYVIYKMMLECPEKLFKVLFDED